jgi:hypothetical protein
VLPRLEQKVAFLPLKQEGKPCMTSAKYCHTNENVVKYEKSVFRNVHTHYSSPSSYLFLTLVFP